MTRGGLLKSAPGQQNERFQSCTRWGSWKGQPNNSWYYCWKRTYIKSSFEALWLRAALSRCGLIKAVWRRAEKEPPACPDVRVWNTSSCQARHSRSCSDQNICLFMCVCCLSPPVTLYLSTLMPAWAQKEASPGTNNNPPPSFSTWHLQWHLQQGWRVEEIWGQKEKKKTERSRIKNKGLRKIKEDRKTGFFAHSQSFDFSPGPGGCLCEITFF